MRKPTSLDQAKHKAELASSLFATIMEKASKEHCSPELQDLIAIACDLNQEISHSLSTEVGA
ncbi:hypothetical protein [Budvicia aquatica]|uniref:Uncharacterized protein n=1 Tax=Budvicia aquatica TaxID=82979 RepID=A0A2C6DS89_9GAMM|nr:hypothetical protein [Budvicia aquatica]PHI31192.1 hypothetical protein CRN84_18535 [Budvicia aquatica]VFS51455.1 Uncharacterised protein [Budvicia aquatica]